MLTVPIDPCRTGLMSTGRFTSTITPGGRGLGSSYSAALSDRPEVELVAGADRDPQRRAMFGERFGIGALYADALAMLDEERLDIVADCDEHEGAGCADGGCGRRWGAGCVGR